MFARSVTAETTGSKPLRVLELSWKGNDGQALATGSTRSRTGRRRWAAAGRSRRAARAESFRGNSAACFGRAEEE